MKYAQTLGSIALTSLLVSSFSGCSDNVSVTDGLQGTTLTPQFQVLTIQLQVVVQDKQD